ncbi:NUDIX domain-containing protein [Nocardioides baculatus]|uniref:NUDIX domain-containing protein n=1 Tax=Nocardioides baculatus TaxID=2801337 RepID=A0ABS1LC05_9ACTN|nr:NUDIX domain-containing protein [Nocardioides baculatus]MBL0748071.1 NUDIX domain-containing protein [Nocardioides baculatus]
MHRFSAVAVLDPAGRLLMQERGDDALHDPGRWGYPGGDLEDGEDFRAAAVRELHEETGLVVEPDRLHSLGVHRFRSESCGEDDELELFAVRMSVTDDDVVCGEGRQMRFVDPQDLGGRPLHQATALTLDRVLAWASTAVRTDFVQVTLVDPRGRVLMQERDEHAPVWPEMWCFPGGGVDEGETPVDGAVRELAEETGVHLTAEDLSDLGRFELVTERGTFHFHAFVARTTETEVECHEGRQMVFVDSDPLPDVDLVPSTALVAPELRRWIADHPFVPDPDGRTFAGVLLVDRAGRILLQERDEHAPIDPEKWGLSGGHVEPGEDFEPAAYRELEEETGVRLAPGTLEVYREFVVDHTRAHGSWDRMQVFVAATDLTDADIDCREGRRIVFVEPEVARGLDLTAAAADIVPAFLDGPVYASMAP